MGKTSVTRFVNVMSGGKFGKGWSNEPRVKKEAIVLSALDAIENELKKMADLGMKDTAWEQRFSALWKALQFGGVTGQKLLDHLDGVAAQAHQALKEVLEFSGRIPDKIDARRILIGRVKDLTDYATGHLNSTKTPLSKELKREISTPLEGIAGELTVLSHPTTFTSEADLDRNIEALQSCRDQVTVLERSARTNLPTKTSEMISQICDKAKANPDSDMGNISGVLGGYFEEYLETIESRKIEHQTDFNGLSHEDLLAIHAYTSTQGMYSNMNALLLGTFTLSDERRSQFQRTIDCCKKALAKLPDYPPEAWPTYRFEDGSKYDWASQFRIGNTFQNKVFWSTGRTGGYDAVGIKGPKLIITIYGKKSGKDVARMADNQTEGGGEILIPPGTRFKVTAIDRSETEIVDGKMIVPKTATVYITVKEV